MNKGTFLRKYNIINRNDMTSVGPVAMQYMCPRGFGNIDDIIVMISEIAYKK